MPAICRWSRPTRPILPSPHFHAAHDAMLCIADSTYVDSADRRKSSPRGLGQNGQADAASCSPICPRRWPTRWSSPSAAPSARPSASRSCPALPAISEGEGAATCATMRAPGWKQRLAPWPASPTSRARRSYLDRLEFEARRDQPDGLCRLLPDRRRLSSNGPRNRTFRWGRGAARARARWSPGR